MSLIVENFKYYKDILEANYGVAINYFNINQIDSSIKYASKVVSMSSDITFNEGLLKANQLLNWNIYPNPANDHIVVEMSENQAISNVTLLDLTGRKVKEWSWEEGSKMTLDISEIPEGYFILNLSNNAQSWSKKLLIK